MPRIRDGEQMLRKARCLLCSPSRVRAGGLEDVGVHSSLDKAPCCCITERHLAIMCMDSYLGRHEPLSKLGWNFSIPLNTIFLKVRVLPYISLLLEFGCVRRWLQQAYLPGLLLAVFPALCLCQVISISLH